MYESTVKSTFIPSSWNKSSKKVDSGMETMPMLSREIGCEPMEPIHVATQTEAPSEEKLSARGVLISRETVDLILEAIKEAGKTNKYFERLEEFKKKEKLQLILIKKLNLESTEKLPVVFLKCGRNNRIALLFGHPQHESWCFHTGHVVIFHKGKSTSIHLGSCPSQLAFAPQQQVIIGTATGELLVTFDGDVLWQSDSVHSQAVTCLKWVSPNLLFTSGLDGRLVLSSLKATSLEAIKSGSISVSDLPKSMRRSNANSRKTGIVAATGSKRDYFLAGETGAIWTLDTETLNVQPMGSDPQGIEQFINADDFGFISVSPEKQIKKIAKDGLNSEILIPNVKTNSNLCLRGNLLLFVDSSSSKSVLDGGPILGFDLEENELVLREDSQSYLSVDLNENSEVVAVDSKHVIHIFQFAD
ncbi:hypothetical protein FO519_001809 [Halicephalobus sp. NKZ332]|nr:hypothetical protein FO519_001809 [Halicephalobus sp. NKZ332]